MIVGGGFWREGGIVGDVIGLIVGDEHFLDEHVRDEHVLDEHFLDGRVQL